MEKIRDKFTEAISTSMSNAELATKCEKIAKEHVLQVLDSLSHVRVGSFDELYIRISKKRMSIQAGE